MSPRFAIKRALIGTEWEVLLHHGPRLLRVNTCDTYDEALVLYEQLTGTEQGRLCAKAVVEWDAAERRAS